MLKKKLVTYKKIVAKFMNNCNNVLSIVWAVARTAQFPHVCSTWNCTITKGEERVARAYLLRSWLIGHFVILLLYITIYVKGRSA